MIKRSAKLLRRCREGVISSWFFCMFLYCISLAAVVAENEIRCISSMINLRISQSYLNAECEVIRDINALASCGELEDGSYETASFTYSLSVNGSTVYAEIDDPYETLVIELCEDGSVYDYEADRDPDEVMEP